MEMIFKSGHNGMRMGVNLMEEQRKKTNPTITVRWKTVSKEKTDFHKTVASLSYRTLRTSRSTERSCQNTLRSELLSPIFCLLK